MGRTIAAVGHFETNFDHGSNLKSWSLAPSCADGLALALEQLRAVGAQLALGIDEAVKRLTRDAKFRAQVADLGVTIGHSGLRQAKLGRRHRVGPAAVAPSRPRR